MPGPKKETIVFQTSIHFQLLLLLVSGGLIILVVLRPASGVRGFVMSNGLRQVSLILIIPIFRKINKLLPKSLLHLAVLVGYKDSIMGNFTN